MRKIGHIKDAAEARRFEDVLVAEGIECNFGEPEGEGYPVWILDDDDIQKAATLLAAFEQDPDDPRFSRREDAEAVRKQSEALEKSYQKHDRNLNNEWAKKQGFAGSPLTFILMGLSILVFLMSKGGEDLGALKPLLITDVVNMGEFIRFDPALGDLKGGQVWRLFTPMLIHFGLLHIIFNMWWLKDLGGILERKHGTIKFLVMVLVVAGLSNLAEFYFSFPDLRSGPSPMFGGMSGVVYGLLGFLWVRGKVDPTYGIRLNPQVMMIMMGWLILCYMPFLGMRIANVAHTVGLLAGIGWGLLSAPRQA